MHLHRILLRDLCGDIGHRVLDFFERAFLLDAGFLAVVFFGAAFFLAVFLPVDPNAFAQFSEYWLFDPLCNTVTLTPLKLHFVVVCRRAYSHFF